MTFFKHAFIILATSLLIACGGGGGSDSESTATGTISFSATDAPVDNVTTVQVTIDGIELKPKNGSRVAFDFNPVTIANLLDYTGSTSFPVINGLSVPAGEYNWIRLFVVDDIPNSKVVEDGGGEFDLRIPGSQGNSRRFLHLNKGFTVAAGGVNDFTLDFVLRKGLTKPNGNTHYLLRPSLRIVDNLEVGQISGTVDAVLLSDISCTNDIANDEGTSVYLYSDPAVTPDDVFVTLSDPEQGVDPESAARPISSADVTQNSGTGAYEYEFGFIAEGEYTLALTCQSLDDTPDLDEDIAFLQVAGTTVVSNQESTHNFTSSP